MPINDNVCGYLARDNINVPIMTMFVGLARDNKVPIMTMFVGLLLGTILMCQ